MLWRVLQFSVFFAVVASNIEGHWTSNQFVVVVFGIGAAYASSCLVYSVLHWRQELIPRRFHKREIGGPPPPGVGPKRLS